jgi:radical SAM protein with 4Fe4S-binding SPASM domain
LPEKDHYEFARATKKGNTRYCYHLCQLHLTVSDVEGNIIPCCFLRDKKFYFGNIFSSDLYSIWNSEKYKKFRKLTASNVEKCSSCEFIYVCTAGCCGEAEGNDGSILKVYPWCKEKPFERDYLHIENHELVVVDKLAAGTFDFIKL